MTPELESKIRGLAVPADPTEDQIAAVLRGWNELFAHIGVTPDEQEAEFDAIMRARVRAGVVSLVADRVLGGVKLVRIGAAYMPAPPFPPPWRLS